MKRNDRGAGANQESKGQSFVELALIFTILLTLLAGMVEFGNLLNQYINLVDGAREGARFGSNDNPFEILNDGTTNFEPFFAKVYEIVEGRYVDGVKVVKGALNPIELNPDTDDIVVTFYSITSVDPVTGSPKAVPFSSSAGSRYDNKTTQFTASRIEALIDPTAPNTGLVLVEIFFAYNQILKLFSFTGIPDPINVHVYSIMPLSSAEPTPTPLSP